MLGFSEQWSAPADGEAWFRFGGAVQPASLAPQQSRGGRLSEAATRVVHAAGLVGLNSVDFLFLRDDGFDLLEVNPQPGATLRHLRSGRFGAAPSRCS